MVHWSGRWWRVIVGVGPPEGLRIGCRWGLGLVECEIHLRTLSPVVCTDRLVNRRQGFGGEQEGRMGGGGGGCGGPRAWNNSGQPDRRIRGKNLRRAVTSSVNFEYAIAASSQRPDSLMEAFGNRSFFPPPRDI